MLPAMPTKMSVEVFGWVKVWVPQLHVTRMLTLVSSLADDYLDPGALAEKPAGLKVRCIVYVGQTGVCTASVM